MLLDRFPKFHGKGRRKDETESQEMKAEPAVASTEFYNVVQPQPLRMHCDDEEMVDGDEDVISMDLFVRTPISTPMDVAGDGESGTGMAGPPFPPYLRTRARQNTASSLSSSISDFHGGSLWGPVMAPNPVSGSGNFTPQFLQLMMEVYTNVCSDPTVTPFDTVNPPSGIVNRVAKIAVEDSKTKDVEIGYERNSWLLTLVRHRLLEEVRRDSYLSRSGSAISIPPPPQLLEGSGLAPAAFEGSTLNENPLMRQNSQDYFGSWNFPSTSRVNNGLIRTRSNSSQLLLNQPGLVRTRSDNNSLFALTPTSSETNLASGFGLRQRSSGLAGPQLCNGATSRIATPTVAAEDPATTLRRKRDSLRLKR
ncbi:uncharacterized protein ZBIST_2593 [Zygosaccharomyces bailii]|nr:uncharacterized protein ZBIST_2593 [Zygosaccharomyces bailii]